MPSKSRTIIKSRRKDVSTHQKSHRWESFSLKISKLHSLDPLRRVRRHELGDDDFALTSSHFREGLDRWGELNISQQFLSFRKHVLPLTDSLAQILHHQQQIMDLLADQMEQEAKESLEPLLDLVTAFAHDLGIRFEKHFPRVLGLIIDMASKNHDVEIIEWTFAALAFLFKYLARLLVPDLRPTYDMIAPLMGKVKQQKGHIARFAAEAMSFLIKKAAAPSYREKALGLIVDHVRKDVESTASADLYVQGIMTMFAEAMKGAGKTLHSTAPDTLAALIQAVPESGSSQWGDICCGVLTSIIHHSTAETFHDIEERLLGDSLACEKSESGSVGKAIVYMRLLGISAGVRKGSRLQEWASLVQAVCRLLALVTKSQDALPVDGVWEEVLVPAAIVWASAPMDAILPSLPVFTSILSHPSLQIWFISFCHFIAELNAERFQSAFLTDFQRFINSRWSDAGSRESLCVAIPEMLERNAIPSSDSISLPLSFQDDMATKLASLEVGRFPENGGLDGYPATSKKSCLPTCSALLRLLECSKVHAATRSKIVDVLHTKLELALRPTSACGEEASWIASEGLLVYLRMSGGSGRRYESLLPLVRSAAPRFCHSPAFLDALLAYEAAEGSEVRERPADTLIDALVGNLSAPCHRLRLSSLKVFKTFECLIDSSRTSALSIMLQIEELPTDLQHSRAIGAHLRKLVMSYAQIEERCWEAKAIPAFLFGMLTVPLSPVWDEAIAGMAQVAQSRVGEDLIADTAFAWLAKPSPPGGVLLRAVEPSRVSRSDFECLHLDGLRKIATSSRQVFDQSARTMLEQVQKTHVIVPSLPDNARTRALMVLNRLPAMAEKRSRKLVPHLLFSSKESEDLVEQGEGGEELECQTIGEDRWSREDRRALVGIFAKFQNPHVLYQSQKVRASLLDALGNGDIELQRQALKAIMSWRGEGVLAVREHLEYLLDEARFRDELTVLFQGDTKIKPEHRAEVIPVLLPLLYGRTISKKGAGGGKDGLEHMRLAVLRHLNVEDMGLFIDIALGELAKVRVSMDGGHVCETEVGREVMRQRKQVGLLNMIDSISTELGASAAQYADRLTNAVLYCLIRACRCLQKDDIDELAGPASHSSVALPRLIRSTGLKALGSLFRNAASFDWKPFSKVMVREIVSPRMAKFSGEESQSVSALFKLLGIWSERAETGLFLSMDSRILPRIADCLGAGKTKEDVKLFALGIISKLVSLALDEAPAAESKSNSLIRGELLDANMDMILKNINKLLGDPGTGRNLLSAAIDLVVALTRIVKRSDASIREEMIGICSHLLRQAGGKVNPKIKGSILLILKHFIAAGLDGELKTSVYQTLASLFGFFKDRQNRQTLVDVFDVFASNEPSLGEIARLCSDLNSWDDSRVNEPDFHRRLSAFAVICRHRRCPFRPDEWKPLLHNLLFYMNVEEDFGVLASNAADGICNFISSGVAQDRGFLETVESLVLPAIYAASRKRSEGVRREHLRVFGFLASHLKDWEPVTDLQPLVPVDAESDSAFFFHILSPAVSRQMQAMQLLEKVNRNGEFKSKHVSQFFIPLLEHPIFDRGEEAGDDHGLSAAATGTIGSLCASLDFQHYRALVRRLVGYIESKPEQQKRVIRLLNRVVDSLSMAVGQSGMDAMEMDGVAAKCRLAVTLPSRDKLALEIQTGLLPTLSSHLSSRDERMVSERTPVGVIIAKLLVLLPEQVLGEKLAGMLTDICNILKSKSWEAREMAREAIGQIAAITGPAKLPFILTDMRATLTRGYQRHVLSYTVHAILLQMIPTVEPGGLDESLSAVMDVVLEDVFGDTGQEKEEEDYWSKMKEVRSRKSQDSLELVAKVASIHRLGDLLNPLLLLLHEKLDSRTLRKVDELLTRITSGLLVNPAAESRDSLVLCHEIIAEVYKSRDVNVQPRADPKLRKYLYLKAVRKSEGRSGTQATHKLIRFALDLLRTVCKKHESVRTWANLEAFLPILGDAVLSMEEEIKVAVFKLLLVLVKVPCKTRELSDLFKVSVREAIKSVTMSPSTTSDLAQAAMKLISTVLRERREIPIKDAAVDVLLGKLRDDLTEPRHRHIAFAFTRAILERGVETAAVYDLLDFVGNVMITNDDKETRELARSCYFQFLKDYRQKKSRWKKQLAFIVANLQYDGEGGRLSVCEVIHLLLKKCADEFCQEVAATCFIPLVFVLTNDDSEKCRLAAGELIKEIFALANQEHMQKFLSLMRGWIGKKDKVAVVRLGLQAFAFYHATREASGKEKKDFNLVFEKTRQIVASKGEDGDGEQDLLDAALLSLRTLLEKYPEAVLGKDSGKLWTDVTGYISRPSIPVQLNALGLMASYLMDFGRKSPAPSRLPLPGSHGLEFGQKELTHVVRAGLRVFDHPHVNEQVAEEVGQILIFLGGYLGSTKTDEAEEEEDQEEEEEEEVEKELEDGHERESRPISLKDLFWKLSTILRQETSATMEALVPKVAAMDIIESLCSKTSKKCLQASIKTILRPLRNLTDPSIPTPFSTNDIFKTRYEELKTRAQTVMDTIQRRVGTEDYSSALLAVGQQARERREQRASKRKIGAITEPERHFQEKRKRFEKKKEKRKDRGQQQRAHRQGYQ